jgi:hypothetical protein
VDVEPINVLLYFNFNDSLANKIFFVAALRLAYFKTEVEKINTVLVEP